MARIHVHSIHLLAFSVQFITHWMEQTTNNNKQRKNEERRELLSVCYIKNVHRAQNALSCVAWSGVSVCFPSFFFVFCLRCGFCLVVTFFQCNMNVKATENVFTSNRIRFVAFNFPVHQMQLHFEEQCMHTGIHLCAELVSVMNRMIRFGSMFQ